MLYDFFQLKSFVKKTLGIDPDLINSNFKPITKTFHHNDIEKHIEFNTDGISFVENGVKYKGFLYIEGGYSRSTAQKNGWRTIRPKFHIVNCDTIEQKKRIKDFNGKYVFSNQPVSMEELDGVERELEICENCVRIKRSIVHKGMTTSNYIQKVVIKEGDGNFREYELPKQVTTDFWGYTSDWDNESKNYRMKNKFTCSDCGIALNRNFSDGYYLETHHLDGNKKNNLDSNLKCLCVLCHANVDDIHFENYSKGQKRQKLRDFINLFEDELIGKNKYLAKYLK